MINQKIKTYWIEKIEKLKFEKGVLPELLTENEGSMDDTVWQNKLEAIDNWVNIRDYALAICKDIYDKTTVTNSSDTWPQRIGAQIAKLADASDGRKANDEYWDILWENLRDLENQNVDLIDVFKDKIGVDPEDTATITKKINNIDTPYPKWKDDIERRIFSNQTRLIDIPDGTDIADLLYIHSLYEEISAELPDLFSRNLADSDKANKFDINWYYKVNITELNNLKNLKVNSVAKVDYDALSDKLTQINNELNVLKPNGDISNNNVKDLKKLKLGHSDIGTKLNINITQTFLPDNWTTKLVNIQELQNRENQIKTACGLDPADSIPNNWENDFNNVRLYFVNSLGLNNPNVLPTIPTGENLNSLLTKSTEYTRIHTKLNGQITCLIIPQLVPTPITTPLNKNATS